MTRIGILKAGSLMYTTSAAPGIRAARHRQARANQPLDMGASTFRAISPSPHRMRRGADVQVVTCKDCVVFIDGSRDQLEKKRVGRGNDSSRFVSSGLEKMREWRSTTNNTNK